MWTAEVKDALLDRIAAGRCCIDAIGSTEGSDGEPGARCAALPARDRQVQRHPTTRVFTEDDREVVPGLRRDRPRRRRRHRADRLLQGPGEVGTRRSGVIDGVRYSFPGDFATVEADGTIILLGRGVGVHQLRRREDLPRGGRGSGQARRRRPSTPRVGIDDETFGQAVTAVAAVAPGASVSEHDVIPASRPRSPVSRRPGGSYLSRRFPAPQRQGRLQARARLLRDMNSV